MPPKTARTDPADDITMHDAFLALLASACGRIAYLTEPTILYRQHGDNEIGARPGVTLREKLAKLLDLRALLEPKRAFLDDRRHHIHAAYAALEVARPGDDDETNIVRFGDDTASRSGENNDPAAASAPASENAILADDVTAARPAGQTNDTSRPYAYSADYQANRRTMKRNLKMHTLPLALRILCYYAWR